MVMGGAKHGIQTFDRRQAGNNAILLILVIIAMVDPIPLQPFHRAGYLRPG